MKKQSKRKEIRLGVASKKSANLFRSLSRSKKPPEPISAGEFSEQAVMVYLPLSDNEFGSEDELDEIEDFCDELEDAIDLRNAGELDGYEYGEGECVIFMYGPSADDVYDCVETILKLSPLCRGAYVIKRYGEPDDPYAKEEKIYL